MDHTVENVLCIQLRKTSMHSSLAHFSFASPKKNAADNTDGSGYMQLI